MRHFSKPNIEKLKIDGDLPGLIEATTYQKDTAIRLAAIKALAESTPISMLVQGDPRADRQTLNALIAALEDEDRDVRRSAAYRLAKVASNCVLSGHPNTSTITAIVGALDDIAIASMFKMMHSMTLPRNRSTIEIILIAALEVEDPCVRRNAIGFLSQLCETQALPAYIQPLIDALADKDEGVRQAASEALKEITQEDLGAEIHRWRKWWDKEPRDGKKELRGGIPEDLATIPN
jgi:HEAT repeat protein